MKATGEEVISGGGKIVVLVSGRERWPMKSMMTEEEQNSKRKEKEDKRGEDNR